MVEGLRRGELDAVCSTDRPEQMQEFETRELFSGHIRIYARRGHPLEGVRNPSAAVLSRYSWITPGARTVPGRRLREMLEGQDGTSPSICLETLVQELATRVLLASDHLLIWAGAADTSILGDGLVEIEKEIPVPSRPVWLIYRSDWEPTGAQRLFLDLALEQANILKELNK
jgi:DNA-binding transcriptional LysR family regulator